MKNNFIFWGAVLGALAVGIGAFGAHALHDLLLTNNRLDTFETASKYHFYHSFSLLVIGILIHLNKNKIEKNEINKIEINKNNKFLNIAGNLHIFGTLIFSGTLYLLCLTNIKWLGAITPIGGVLLIIGWCLVAYSFLNKK